MRRGEADAARLRQHAGDSPPDNRTLSSRIWYAVFAPFRWPDDRRARRGLPPRRLTRRGLAAAMFAVWLLLVVPVALITFHLGGRGPNLSAPDEQYFSWAPSLEHGRRDAVVILVVGAIGCALAGWCGWRQAARDGLVDDSRPPSAAKYVTYTRESESGT